MYVAKQTVAEASHVAVRSAHLNHNNCIARRWQLHTTNWSKWLYLMPLLWEWESVGLAFVCHVHVRALLYMSTECPCASNGLEMGYVSLKCVVVLGVHDMKWKERERQRERDRERERQRERDREREREEE